MTDIDASFIYNLRKRLTTASLGDRMYERPMSWDDADRLLAIVDKFEEARGLFQNKLLSTVKTGTSRIPFGMDGDESALYLSGKADALQWVLEMLP